MLSGSRSSIIEPKPASGYAGMFDPERITSRRPRLEHLCRVDLKGEVVQASPPRIA
jgi:hypothetical protein